MITYSLVKNSPISTEKDVEKYLLMNPTQKMEDSYRYTFKVETDDGPTHLGYLADKNRGNVGFGYVKLVLPSGKHVILKMSRDKGEDVWHIWKSGSI